MKLQRGSLCLQLILPSVIFLQSTSKASVAVHSLNRASSSLSSSDTTPSSLLNFVITTSSANAASSSTLPSFLGINRYQTRGSTVDTETSESRYDPYRTTSASSSSSRRKNASRKRNNLRGQRLRHPSRDQEEEEPLLGVEYEYEDPLTEARIIGELQYDSSPLLAGEENYIERPPTKFREEETTRETREDEDDQQDTRQELRGQRRRQRNRDRPTRNKKKRKEERPNRATRLKTSPSGEDGILERYPESMMPYENHGLTEYYTEHDMSPSYFEHHDYGDGDGHSHDHDYDYGSHHPDHSEHYDEDHDHHDDHHDDDDKDEEESTSQTLVLGGTDNIPEDMKPPYFNDEPDPRERQADAFLTLKEDEADKRLEMMKAAPLS